MNSPKPAIRAQGLSKDYGEGNTFVRALQDCSFELNAGEVVALLGPSGSGKSTLLTILGLINEPTTGDLWIGDSQVIQAGKVAQDVNDVRRQELGFVFQRSNLIPFLSAEENVRLVLELDEISPREAKKRTKEIMAALEIWDRADNAPNKLSGGQQQRVAIARALINEPSLLLADEPTAALDKSRGRQVMGLFQAAARERNAAVLVVTHDHRALDLVDRIFMIEDGLLDTESQFKPSEFGILGK